MESTAIMADPELIKEFLDETKDLLENLDNDLVSLESDPQNKSLIDRIFRAIHTIKGTSSFLGFEQLVELSHAAEDVLHLIRSGERMVTSSTMDVILQATDKIKILVTQIRNNDIKEIELKSVIDQLKAIKDGKTEPETAEPQPEEIEESTPVVEESPKPVEVAKAKQPEVAKPKSPVKGKSGLPEKKEISTDIESSTIRVDVDRLDDLMNLVGELVLERNRLLQINRDFRESVNMTDYSEKVADTTEKIHFITTELQLSVLKTRMVPIDRLFKKFPRLVRDIAREMSKDVELVVSGGETELDKTVIDQLNDPIVHLMRNSIDHGLESPDERQRLGKPRKGTVQLSANQEGNHILITVKDDGRGIDVDKVRQKALDKELVTEEQLQAMSRQEVMQLIFEPGFSTAEKVSNISGRGVGMDVVKTNIRNLNGMIDLYSEKNLGTTIVLKLPLTLAIMQALMVQVCEEIYAIPLASVVETIRIQETEIKNVNQKEVIQHRDTVLPLLRLQKLFDVRKAEGKAIKGNEYVVLVGAGEKKFGLMVDRLLGQEEVVIKSLGDYLGSITGIAGGTITGDGRVRLIVDCANVSELV